ncbi:alkaline phosphatase D family protein [Pelagicoccus mobilis]|uniref:Metallophosphoesterase family protein n=1 Tax=Pelagicoccus mobilis TaxID=415221 RepID=A0A934S275_9BACT|nr:alkaline phosphatase D family protein [Pelagicoccus mobilis]MBK1879719.1 metallophosphoesterase family protein [Pelagicoccus mobilis]
MNKLVPLTLLGAFALQLSAKPPITQGETDPVMLDLDPYMIEALRGGVEGTDDTIPPGRFGSEGSLIDLLEEPTFRKLIKKHDLKLFNGPMVGAVTSSSARFWVRTAGEAEFKVVIGELSSEAVKTTASSDFTGVVTVEGLNPLTEYEYTVVLDGKVIADETYRFQTYPEKGTKERYSVAFGACSRYVPVHEGIWRTMAGTEPLAYLGLGDNVYIDATERRDVQRLHYYRRMLREEYREFIAGTAMYAVWDDHDIGANDCAGGPGLEKPWKLPNLEVFQQNWNNPFYSHDPKVPGTWHNFTVGDVEFFMLDGRFYRTDRKDKTDTSNTMLGEEQKLWLLESLRKSTATFKVLCSGTMWHDLADKGGADSWAGKHYKAERDEIFDFINAQKIDGVVLLAGDRHRTDLWKTERADGYPLYEFLSAKVTNIHTHNTRKQAEWSYNIGNFWGELDFDFSTDDPTITFKAINQDGEVVRATTLELSHLSHKL